MAPVERIVGPGIGVDRDEQDVAAVVEDVLRTVAVVIVDVEDHGAARTGIDRGLGGDGRVVEVTITAEIVGDGMMAGRAAEGEGGPLTGQHQTEGGESGLRGTIGSANERGACRGRVGAYV